MCAWSALRDLQHSRGGQVLYMASYTMISTCIMALTLRHLNERAHSNHQ